MSTSGRSNSRGSSSSRPRKSQPSSTRGTSSSSARRSDSQRASTRSNGAGSNTRKSTGARPASSRSESSRRDARGRDERSPRRDDRRDSRPSSRRGGVSSRDSRKPDDRRSDARKGTFERSDTRGGNSSRPRNRRDDERATSTRKPRPIGKPDNRGGRVENVDETKFVTVDSSIDIKVLPKQVLAELRNISPSAAEFVAKHLAAAMYALEDDDAERAYEHAIAARSRAARLGSVREMVGLSAYYSGKWAEALSEFRTFQRLTGDPGFLPLMADCERGLGRPLRALQIARSPQVNSLDASTKIELRIVASGARKDLGQFEAALATLECPELHSKGHSEAVVRLKYAYADALLSMGQKEAARDWFVKTALADVDDLTDAADRAVQISE